MQPKDTDVRNLALYAPRIALGMIMGVPRVPFVGDIPLQFPSATVEAPAIQASLDNNLTQDTWIERIAFSLYQPNSFAGSPLQADYLAKLKECSGVGIQMSVFGGPKYVLNDTYTDLSNLADIFAVTWPQGWFLAKQSNVRVNAILTQTPTSVPYEVTMTLLGWQFLDKTMDCMSDNDARRRLSAMGIFVPNIDAACTVAQQL